MDNRVKEILLRQVQIHPLIIVCFCCTFCEGVHVCVLTRSTPLSLPRCLYTLERRPDSGALALMRFWISLNLGWSLSATSCNNMASLVVTIIPVRASRWKTEDDNSNDYVWYILYNDDQIHRIVRTENRALYTVRIFAVSSCSFHQFAPGGWSTLRSSKLYTVGDCCAY